MQKSRPSDTTAVPVVDVRQVSLWRGQTRILEDVTWQVQPGEHWAIIGPNGCGKTTLLNIVSGWLFPSRGGVSVLGREFGACDMAELRRQIGWVSTTVEQMLPPQLMTLGVVLTGRNAVLGIREEPTAEELALAREQLAMVGCAAREELPFGLLSTGEQVRVMIARALMAHPRLLILDEPCNGLDPVARDAFLGTVECLARRPGLTILFVTHHLDEIVPAIGQVLALRAGRIVKAGAKAEVLTAAMLEELFGLACEVRKDHGRYYAQPQITLGSIWHLGK